ncbi:hypothetical protein BGX38DRAFT_1150363 [Terfezia claveryi]|nr:hypothetical protein BGX38DRAFT_1150363 [Terfezia claveryi]
MDHEALSHQARAALDSLTYQLQSLEAQQSALLTSLRLTTDSLSPALPSGTPTSIPNYHLISPIFSLIPTYTAKLTRLRNTMSSQTLEITQLRRRVEEVKRGRRRNLERVRERWERERERDRTVLRARMVGVVTGEELVGGFTPKVVGEIGNGGRGEEDMLATAAGVALPGTPVTPTLPISPPGAPEGSGIRVVKRKKKVRQAEMQ